MEFVLTATPRGVFVMLIALLAPVASAVRIFPVLLDRVDYSENIAATDGAHFPTAYTTVEYDRLSGGPPGVVFKKGTSPSLSIRFYNPNFVTSTSGQVTISNCKFTDYYGTDHSLTLNGGSTYSENLTIPSHTTFSTATITVSNLPSFVTKGHLQFTYQVHSPNGLDGFGSQNLPTYLVHDTCDGLQATPWFEVLDYSCVWANSATDIAGVAGTLVSGEWANWTYNPSKPWYTSDDEIFYLAAFLTHAHEMGPVGQCNDFADFLACLLNSQGIGSQATRSYSYSVVCWSPANGDSGWRMITNELLPANGAPGVFNFAYHQFVTGGANYCDGAASQYVAPDTYVLASGWTEATYKAGLVYEFDHYTAGVIDYTGDPWAPTSVTVTISAADHKP